MRSFRAGLLRGPVRVVPRRMSDAQRLPVRPSRVLGRALREPVRGQRVRRERELRGEGRDAHMQLPADDDGRPVRAVPAVRAGRPLRAEPVRRERAVPARPRQHGQGAAGVHVRGRLRGRRAHPVPARRVHGRRRVPARPGVRRLPVQERVRGPVRRGRRVQRPQPRGHVLVPARLHGRRAVPVLPEDQRRRVGQPVLGSRLLQQQEVTTTIWIRCATAVVNDNTVIVFAHVPHPLSHEPRFSL